MKLLSSILKTTTSILKTTTTTTTTTTSTTLLGPAFVLSWSQPPIQLKPSNGKEEARPKQRVRFSTNVRVRQYCIDKKNHMNPADIKQLREKPLDKNQRHQPSLNRDEEEASQQRDGPSKQQSQQPPTPTTTTETPRDVHDSREHAPSQQPSLFSVLPETSPMRLGERVETSILTTAPEPATGVATITAEANSPAMAVSSTEESPFDKDAWDGIEVFVPHGAKWKRRMEHPVTRSRKRRKTDDSGAFELVEESPLDFICRGGGVSLPVCAPTFLSQQSQQHDRKRERDEPTDELPPQKRRRIYTTAAAEESFVANDGDESAWQQLLFGEVEDEDSADFFNAEDSEAMFLLLFGDDDNLDGSLLSRDNCEEEDMLALLFGNEGDSELGAELGAVLVPRRSARRAVAPVSSAPRRSARIAAHRTATAVAPAAPEEYRRPAHLRQIPRVCYKGMC